MRPTRNQTCPCGSGQKYKYCHGKLGGSSVSTLQPIALPPQVFAEFQRRQREEAAHRVAHGDVRSPIAIEFMGHRVVASGRKLAWSATWKVFPDFLNQHLCSLLGSEWGTHQVTLPLDEQHPVVQWRTIFTTIQQAQAPDQDGLFNAATGAANAWFRLAYDLYLIEHNAELQKKLLKRIRNINSFQGARFEAAVAAMMLAAGYDLEYADERGPGKHPEFFATNKFTGHRLAVEAKSKHRPGILGFPGSRAVMNPKSFGIDNLLRDALAKDTAEPLLIFIELNTPRLVENSQASEIHKKLNSAWTQTQAADWPKGFPAIGVVFYNDASPWQLDSQPPPDVPSVFAMTMWPTQSRHSFDPIPLLTRITEACRQRLSIPHEFPDTGLGTGV
ncbi:MAG: SEC-C domain-containing protein [Rhodoferax sp.]